MTTAGNIGIYCPRVFHIRSGTNQSYSSKYDWDRLFPPSKGKQSEEQSSQMNQVK